MEKITQEREGERDNVDVISRHTSLFGVCVGVSLLAVFDDDGDLSRVGVGAASESDLDLEISYFVMYRLGLYFS
jgi:hypothetical protein